MTESVACFSPFYPSTNDYIAERADILVREWSRNSVYRADTLQVVTNNTPGHHSLKDF